MFKNCFSFINVFIEHITYYFVYICTDLLIKHSVNMKKKNGFPVLFYYFYGISIRQIGAHPINLYTLKDLKNDSTLKKIFKHYAKD